MKFSNEGIGVVSITFGNTGQFSPDSPLRVLSIDKIQNSTNPIPVLGIVGVFRLAVLSERKLIRQEKLL
ncbi:MAG: hypothetical protein FJY43_00590 [Betaproteobacteria bacterium]|nr:hypothetical protein [Betaproteobacteria bacterium]